MKKLLFVSIPILFIGIGVYFIFFTPAAQAKRLAEQIIQAAATQDRSQFASHGAPSDSDKFYTTANARNYRLASFDSQNTTFYARYEFTDGNSPKYARIAISGNVVIALATGDGLGTSPSSDAKVTATQTQDSCLAKTDLQFLDATSLYARTIRGATMIFADDTGTGYSGDANADTLLTRMADFYKKTSNKDYIFTVRGFLAASSDTLETRKQVIQNRTTKIQRDLITRGIPEDRITIGQPVAYPVDQPTDGQNERYVIIDVTNNCVK